MITDVLSFIMLLSHLWLQKPIPTKNNHLLERANHWIDVQKKHKDYYDDCTFTKKYSVEQRLRKYPFVKASGVVAVSYHAEEPEPNTYFYNNGKLINPDSSKTKRLSGLHIKNGKIYTKTLTEFVALNQQQINALTNIIYNINYRVKDEIAGFSEGACFESRNALVFLDRNGKVFDYIEICFECRNSKSQSRKLSIGIPCTQKYDILRKYFINLRIKTGTLEN